MILRKIISAACVFGGFGLVAAAEPAHLTPVAFPQVQINDTFWSPRLRANQTATIAANLHQCEITGRLQNFAVAANQAEGKHLGFLFNDSDVYKVIEGIA